jgi:hypothetical protein
VPDLPDAVAPLRDLPAWHVRRGIGSFVTLEFGEPRLEIYDVRDRRLPVAGERRVVPQREAYVRGGWTLWVQYCDWTLTWHEHLLAHSESPDVEIDRALAILNGQKLVSAATTDGSASLAFDLGCVLATRPYSDADAGQEQWQLFQPSGAVLTLHAGGHLTAGRADEPSEP